MIEANTQVFDFRGGEDFGLYRPEVVLTIFLISHRAKCVYLKLLFNMISILSTNTPSSFKGC